jgi:hypothetical protein
MYVFNEGKKKSNHHILCANMAGHSASTFAEREGAIMQMRAPLGQWEAIRQGLVPALLQRPQLHSCQP